MSFLDRFEGRGKWAFHPWIGLWIWLFLCMFLAVLRCCVWGVAPINAAVVAFLGALMACLGAFTIARPVIRAGGYRGWLAKQSLIGGGSLKPTIEEELEIAERLKDSLAVNILGPALAIVGTLMNGASGFLP